jgi:hypothetical protein
MTHNPVSNVLYFSLNPVYHGFTSPRAAKIA